MSKTSLYLYTDASFSPIHEVAVAGFLIFKSPEENKMGLIDHSELQIFSETTNIRAELRGAIFGLEFIKKEILDFDTIQFFTDCKTISQLVGRRTKLERQNYISSRKNQPLSNTDLYKLFFSNYDRLLPKVNWIKGHSPTESLTSNERNFRVLDQMVRKELRKRVGELGNES